MAERDHDPSVTGNPSTDTQPYPVVGQIWRDTDPREERFVLVCEVGQAAAVIRRVVRDADGWLTPSRSPIRTASLGRFNGKSGGYEFVENSGHPATDASAQDTGVVTDEIKG